MEYSGFFISGTEGLFLGIGTFFDLKLRQLPAGYLLTFLILSLLENIGWKYQGIRGFCLGMLPGILLLLIGYLTGEKIGYGDGAGVLILGSLGGFWGVLLLVADALLLSGLTGIFYRVVLKKKLQEEIPFYPFLLISWIGGIL